MTSTRERVENFLLKYDPTKIRTVDALLTSFEGKDAQLITTLSRKYGPEPTAAEVPALRAALKKASAGAVENSSSPPQRPTFDPPGKSAAAPSQKPAAPSGAASTSKSGSAPGSKPSSAPGSKPSSAASSKIATPPRAPTPGKSTPEQSKPSSPIASPSKASAKSAPPSSPNSSPRSSKSVQLPPPSPKPASQAASGTSAPNRKAGTPSDSPSAPSPVAPTSASSGKSPASPKATGKTGKSASKEEPLSAAINERIRHDALVTVLENMYNTYAPERVGDVENILASHDHEIPEMFQAMESKYKMPAGSLQEQVNSEIQALEAKARSGQLPEVSNVSISGGAASPSLTRTMSRVLQDTSVQVMQQVVEEFFAANAPERVPSVPDIIQLYSGRYPELFEQLQTDFRLPDTFFKAKLAEKGKEAAASLMKRDGVADETTGGSSGSSGKKGKGKTSAANEKGVLQFWTSVEKSGKTSTSSAAAAASRPMTFREQLEYFCDRYCPNKAASIDRALRSYRGREFALIEELHKLYGVEDSAEYLPTPEELMRKTANEQRPLERVPESMRPAAEVARHFGLGPQFVPRIIENYGREDDKRVTFEVLAALFPDAVMHALSDEEQRAAFAAKRVAHFLSFHHPTAKGATGRIMQEYVKAGKADAAMGDLLVRYYGTVLESVKLQAFRPSDMTSSSAPATASGALHSTPSMHMRSQLDALDASPPRLQRQDTSFGTFVGSPAGDAASPGGDNTAADVVLRRREFRRCVEEWSAQYGPTGAFSRTTPRFLGRLGETASSYTSTVDLPRDVKDASALTFHREHEEARLLGLVERGMVTEPFTFEIKSYHDTLDQRRRGLYGGGNGGSEGFKSQSEMRKERHKELYGMDSQQHAATSKTVLPNPLIFLEDEDCSKCRVLQHQLDTVTQRLHILRAQHQYKERLLKYEEMEREAEADALLTQMRRGSYNPSLEVSAKRSNTCCEACMDLQHQVRSLSAKLHSLRTRQQTAALPGSSPVRSSPSAVVSGGLWAADIPSMEKHAVMAASPLRILKRDASTITELDSSGFKDLRNFFILDAL